MNGEITLAVVVGIIVLIAIALIAQCSKDQYEQFGVLVKYCIDHGGQVIERQCVRP